MKKTFKEFYEYSERELAEIWASAIFIFDTNILTGLYRLPESLRKDLIKILKGLEKEQRIWTPYNVLYEFHKNRRNVIIGLEEDYNQAVHAVEGLIAELPKKVEGKLKSACDQHPLLNFDDFYKDAKESLQGITKKIKTIKSKKHPKWKQKDEVLKEIEKIFHNFGIAYSEKELNGLYKEGEKRYKEMIPPGYKDCKNHGGDKEGNERFGDLIIWKQILDFANKNDKSIVFVTNDVKEDWWIKEYNKNVKPRFELRKEFFENSDNDLDICDLDMFLEKSNTYLNSNISDNEIKQVRKIKQLEKERMIMRNNVIRRDRELRHKMPQRYYAEYIHNLQDLDMSLREIYDLKIDVKNIKYNAQKIKLYMHSIKEGYFDKKSFYQFYFDMREFLGDIEKRIEIHPYLIEKIRQSLNRLQDLNDRHQDY